MKILKGGGLINQATTKLKPVSCLIEQAAAGSGFRHSKERGSHDWLGWESQRDVLKDLKY